MKIAADGAVTAGEVKRREAEAETDVIKVKTPGPAAASLC